MKFLPLVFAAICLSACCTMGPSGPTRVIKEKGATITYALPKGWKTVKVEEPSDHAYIIAPAGVDNPAGPSITIDYSDIHKATEQECATAYLDSVREIKDPKVRMSNVGTVKTASGPVTIYRLASAYYGDHLVSFLVAKRGYAIVELWATTAAERAQQEPAFRETVAGLSVKN